MTSKNGIVLIPLVGMSWMADRIKKHIGKLDENISCEIVQVDLPRFITGDAKAVLQSSVRGKDVFIITDVGNYDCTYCFEKLRKNGAAEIGSSPFQKL